MLTVPVCSCHGEPKRWQKDGRHHDGGYWICRIRKRELDLASQARARTDPARVATRHRSQLAYWHKQDGGYVKRRRRQLQDGRARALARLRELEQEAKSLC